MNHLLVLLIIFVVCASVPKGVSAQEASYQPIFAWSASDGQVGDSVRGWYGHDVAYSDDISSPFGNPVTAKNTNMEGALFYGGILIDERDSGGFASLGDRIWVRIYLYFSENFCFNYGSKGDGWGSQKFFRFEDDRNPSGAGGRYTAQIASDSSGGCRTTSYVWGATDEIDSGGLNDVFSPVPKELLVRGKWISMEIAMKLGDQNTNDGYMRVWIDDTYQGEVSGIDNVGVGRHLSMLVFGNYWNGGFTQYQAIYIDEIIATVQEPNNRDSEGRPFIGRDVMATSLEPQKRPNPPKLLVPQ